MEHPPLLTAGNQPIEISCSEPRKTPANRALGDRLSFLTIRDYIIILKTMMICAPLYFSTPAVKHINFCPSETALKLNPARGCKRNLNYG